MSRNLLFNIVRIDSRFLRALPNIVHRSYAITALSNNRRSFCDGGSFKIKVGEVLDDWNTRFFENEILEPRESIENILMHVLKTRKFSDVYKMKNKVLSLRELKEINKLANLRLNKMPVQYIVGEWDFRDVNLIMRPPVFIPRPETEQLVEHVLKELEENKDVKEVLEICCGSGAISLALLKARTDIQVIALDISKDACQLTKENAQRNNLDDRLEVKQGDVANIDDMLNLLEGRKFQVIVGNPPYIPANDMENLQAEIRMYEDRAALDGGSEDGLKLIKLILKVMSEILVDGGKLYLEADPSQPELLKSWFAENNGLGLQILNTYADFSASHRFLEIIKKPTAPSH